jgi:hypothetical protein
VAGVRWFGVSGARVVWWAAVVVLAGAVVLQALPAVAAAAPAAVVADPAGAVRAARQLGQSVMVGDLTTENSVTVANPDGSYTAQVFAAVQRVRQSDGSWVGPDPTLVHQADGSWAPRAAAVGVRFSGGGSVPFVQAQRGRAQLSLSWPTSLPAPTVAGDTVTYADVLAGVDLRVRAEVDGFAEVLVVKDADAAKNPALTQLGFSVASAGLAARVGGGGSVAWVDGTGVAVFSAGSAVQWDSSVLADAASRAARDGAAGQLMSQSSDRQPATGAAASTMSVTLDGDVLRVVPDTSMLTSASTHFPVFIDPVVRTVTNSNWSMINAIHPTQSYWSFDRADGAKVGYENIDDELYRSMFVFSTSPFAHAVVTAATFTATLTHTALCPASGVDLYRTAVFGSATTWNNHASTWTPKLASQSGAACDDTPVALEFASTALTQQVNTAAGNASSITLGLRAPDETHSGRTFWKKFQSNTAKLTVTFDHQPALPDQLFSGGASCVTGAGRPRVGASKMQARVVDPDGDSMSVAFQWKQLNPDGSYPSGLTGTQTVTSVGSGTALTITPSLIEGKSYGWQVQATDSAGQPSGWAGWCEFTVDTTAPPLPGVTPPAGLYNSDTTASGDVGVPGTFTLTPGGASDVVSYAWYLQSSGYTSATSGPVTANGSGIATITATPHSGGLNTLFVQSKDSANNTSAWRAYVFRANASGPVGWWHANEAAGTSLNDDPGVGSPHTLTLAGSGSLWSSAGQGRILGGDAAIAVNGTDGRAQAASAVLDLTTSYTVAAWAMPTTTAGDRTVVSQDGSAGSGVRLQITGGQWCLTQDATHRACASGAADAPIVNQWAHLLGVYDAGAATLRLFVDGVLKSEVAAGTATAATGSFAVGRGRVSGAAGEWFGGQIDDIRVWQRVVYDNQATLVANDTDSGVLALLGDWELEGDGTDWSDFGAGLPGHQGTPNAHATFVTAPVGAPSGSSLAADLDGSAPGGQVSFGPGPVFRTDQSYTLSAWIRLDALPTASSTAVTEDGTCVGGMNVGLHFSGGVNRWQFGLRSSDCGASPTFPAATTGSSVFLQSSDVGHWFHVVASYDRGQAQLRLFVDGTLIATAAHTTPWGATGALTFGNDLSFGSRVDQFDGQIDQVKVYLGALTTDQIAGLS